MKLHDDGGTLDKIILAIMPHYVWEKLYSLHIAMLREI